jgi:hypothetical protein
VTARRSTRSNFTCTADGSADHQGIPADSTHFPEPQRESSFGDSSGPLFSLYSKIAEGDDDKMTERWQKDTKGLLIFVSACHGVNIPALTTMNWNTTDWFVLCYSCCTTRCHHPGHKTKSSGHLRILSRENLSDSRRSKRHGTRHILSFYCSYTTSVLPSDVCHLGKFTLVLESSDQHYVCSVGDITTTMCASIHHGHPELMVQSTEASTKARILCCWRGQDVCTMGSRSIARPDPPLLVPFFIWPHNLSGECRSQCLQVCDLVDRPFLNLIWMDHLESNPSARQPLLWTAFVDSLVSSRFTAMCALSSPSPHRAPLHSRPEILPFLGLALWLRYVKGRMAHGRRSY